MFEKNLYISYLLDFYGEALPSEQREIMIEYYNDDLSLAEIAETRSITRQGVRSSIKRAEAELLRLEEKLSLFSHQNKLDEMFRKLCEDADRLEKGISNGDAREELLLQIKEIKGDLLALDTVR